MLAVEGLCAGYAGSQVLFDLDLRVGSGELVTLMGRNGMGKTTTVRALMGLLPASAGSIRLDGRELAGLPPHRVARAGLGLVPEGRQVFPNLTVRENLVATARPPAGAAEPWTLARVTSLFPRLAERAGTPGGRLSGGEQQMLAIGRALMTNPRLLVLDEATEGLAPTPRAEIWACLERLKRDGLSILLIDKHAARLLDLADRHLILEKGRLAWQGSSAELRALPGTVERLLGA
jgi:branched-chain amino acid transport system ATP-binding protein